MALATAALALPAGALSQDATPYRAQWPVPKAALIPEEAAVIASGADDFTAADPLANADAGLFEPLVLKPSLPARRGDTIIPVRRVPVEIIRDGLTAQGLASVRPADRVVGVKLGADVLAVSTKLVAPAIEGAGSDARIEWLLAKPIAVGDTGFIWTVSTGGSGSVAGHPEQSANLLIGYRQPLFAFLTLTSKLTMQASYVFAPGNGGHSAIVPEISVSADLGALGNLPVEATFDLGLARQMPVLASQYETRGSAMLRMKYRFD